MATSSAAASPVAPIFALTRVEWRIGRRSPVFRLALVAAFVFGLSVGGDPSHGVALSAFATAEAACQYMGFIAVVWMALAAVRETTLRTDILVFSKPQPSEWLALSKFIGAYIQLLAMLLAMFAGGIASRSFAGPMTGLEAYLPQYFRAAAVLLFTSAASYMLALLFDSALAGATIGLYWLLIAAGKAFLGKYYFPMYSQNLTAYLCLSLALLFTTLYFYRRARRGSRPASPWVRAGAPLFALLAAWQFWLVIMTGHDPDVHENQGMIRMTEQDTTEGGRAAGFMLPDQRGKLTGLAQFDGKILVIALWSPRDPDSVLLLDRLNDVAAKLGPAGVQPIAVTICEDVGASSLFAFGERLNYPVVADWGTFNAPKGSELSPIADAYRCNALPTVYITDRRRNVKTTLVGIDSYERDSLTNALQQRLAEEPR
ncbi:MAG TPA: hypothetical protein VKT77_19640 [Chthonomonadaceae bacterium]|nr:hypothetical protein [Chthonomonadaceae bacterium]